MSSLEPFKRFHRGRQASAFSIALVSTLFGTETVAAKTTSTDKLNEQPIGKVQQAVLNKVATSIDTLIKEKQSQHHYLNVVKAEAVLQQSLSSVQSLLLNQCEKIGINPESVFANLNRIIGKPTGDMDDTQASQASIVTNVVTKIPTLTKKSAVTQDKADNTASEPSTTKASEALAVSQAADAKKSYQYIQSIRANTNTKPVNEQLSADTVVINLQQYAQDTGHKSPANYLKIPSANNHVEKPAEAHQVKQQLISNNAANKNDVINVQKIAISMAELVQVDSVDPDTQTVVIPGHRINSQSIKS